MIVEHFPPDADTEPRHWVRHDQAFAMMLRPGSIEWGYKRSALEKFDYAAGDLSLCHRHEGEWVGLMNVPHLQIVISDAGLMASSDGAGGEVECALPASLPTLASVLWLQSLAQRCLLAFPAGGCFWILSNTRWP
jgi:hypothetical protein